MIHIYRIRNNKYFMLKKIKKILRFTYWYDSKYYLNNSFYNELRIVMYSANNYGMILILLSYN